jgi:hypothetical protein
MTVAISSGLGALALIGIMVVADEARAQNRCQSLKWKAAGVAAKMKAACYASAAKEGVDVDPACLAKADARLAKRWSAAEEAGGCVTTGDLAAASGAVDQCSSAIGAVVAPPPPPTSLCCNLGTACAQGMGLDAEGCVTFFGGTVGPAGSVCNGATGACEAPPAGFGRCCMSTSVSFCTGGPNLDLSGCVPPSFLDFPFAVCSPSGACLLP